MPSSQIDKISSKPVTSRGSGYGFSKSKTLCIHSQSIAIISIKWNGVREGLGVAITMALLIYLILMEKDDHGLFAIITSIIFFSIPLLWGIGCAADQWGTRHIVIDKEQGKVLQCTFIKNSSRGKCLCNISDVIAVQLCSNKTIINSGKSNKSYYVYEINLAFNDLSRRHLNLMVEKSKIQIKKDVISLADFLGVPLVVHCNEESNCAGSN